MATIGSAGEPRTRPLTSMIVTYTQGTCMLLYDLRISGEPAMLIPFFLLPFCFCSLPILPGSAGPSAELVFQETSLSWNCKYE